MTILFLPDSHWNDDRQIVQFYAVDQLNRIPCAISKEALDDHSENGTNPLDIFRSNRDTIEAIASKLISRGRFESDGSILIEHLTADFPYPVMFKNVITDGSGIQGNVFLLTE